MMRAYIVTVTANMPARDTVMGLAGYNSRHYCNYYNARGCSGASRADRTGTVKRTPGPQAAENQDGDLEDADADYAICPDALPLGPSAVARAGNSHIYCPLTPPVNVQRDDDWRDYKPDELPLREHQQDKEAAQFARDPANTNAQLRALTRLTGIKSYSSLWELPSILWPWSFPLDNMHLFFLNIAPHMRDHWRGNFFP